MVLVVLGVVLVVLEVVLVVLPSFLPLCKAHQDFRSLGVVVFTLYLPIELSITCFSLGCLLAVSREH